MDTVSGFEFRSPGYQLNEQLLSKVVGSEPEVQALSGDETVQFRIPGDPKYVSIVRRAVDCIARNLGFPEEAAEDIALSVAEALANAVEHGSPERKDNAVVVACRISDDSLTIDVRDEGPGFDLPNAANGGLSMNERGRGLRLIYRLMDNVRVSRTRKGSRIRMVKNKQAREQARSAGSR